MDVEIPLSTLQEILSEEDYERLKEVIEEEMMKSTRNY